MNEEQIKLLINIGVSSVDIENCFITKDGKIFTPLKDEDGNVLKKGEQIYREWLANKDKSIGTEENLIDKLILDNINMQMQIDNLIENQLGGK